MNASSGSGLWPMRTSRSAIAAPVRSNGHAREGDGAARRVSPQRLPHGARAWWGGAGSVARGHDGAEVAGADRADDRVAIARGLHLDPRAAEVRRTMRVVGG